MNTHVPDDVIQWLLGEDNPPVRYLTLVHLLGQDLESSEVRDARSRLMDYEVTREILAHGSEFWHPEKKEFWQSYRKYQGRFWQMIFLGQFLADGHDPRIAPGVESILEAREFIDKRGIHCLTANILCAAMRLGFADHPIVPDEVEALAQRVVRDSGVACSAMGYSLLTHCYMCIPKLIFCFAEIPEGERSKSVRLAIEILAETLIENQVHIYVSAHRKVWQGILAEAPKKDDLPKGQTVKAWIAEHKRRFLEENGYGALEPKEGWLKFGFPLNYNSDVLEALFALAQIGTPMSSSLAEPLRIVQGKRTDQGTWKLENSLNGKMWANVEEKGKPSKWLTLSALRVIAHFKPTK
jgi:hypothetical protein